MKDIVISLAILLTPLLLLRVVRLGFRWQHRRRLILQGRSISWKRALSSDGILVTNRTSLPGNLWFIPRKATQSSLSLFRLTEESGFIVLALPFGWRKTLKQPCLSEKILTLSDEPLVSVLKEIHTATHPARAKRERPDDGKKTDQDNGKNDKPKSSP